jgi:ubiquinol-cytochrome c reductase iron-sulfur subunit
MKNAAEDIDRTAVNRRNFFYATTAAAGAAGVAIGTWPLLDQMNPDARERAANDVIEIDLAALPLGKQHMVRWHGCPIFVVRRTAVMLNTMQDEMFVAQLYDPDSRTHQQPPYAKNWHRSIDPAFAVLVGICTQCAVVPTYCSESSSQCVSGGYACPFCASHYDPASRAYSGISRYNLPVPPHRLVGKSQIELGKNTSDASFTLTSVERI